jgi:N6-adenosine-specific RNA methylase IME4
MPEYHTISIDPPWNETGGGKSKRGADRHYKTIRRKEDIADVIKGSGKWNPADNAHLYLWATNNYLVDALWLMDNLGFRYVTNIAWVKVVPEENWTTKRWGKLLSYALHYGMGRAVMRWVLKNGGLGQYFHGQHELLLFGVRGKGKDPITYRQPVDLWGRAYTGTVMFAPVGEHSEKPEESFELMEARSQGPRLEMFARNRRRGWDTWGDQAPS